MKIKRLTNEELRKHDLPLDFYDDKICLENSNYVRIFNKKFVEKSNKPQKRGIVKIKFIQSGNSSNVVLYRLFLSGNSLGIGKNEIGLPPLTSHFVTNFTGDIKLTRGSRFFFIWQHPNHLVRIGFKYTFVLGVLSTLLGVISLFISLC